MNLNNTPQLSIITINRNDAQGLEKTLCTVSLPSICWVILVQTIGEILTVTNKTIDKIL